MIKNAVIVCLILLIYPCFCSAQSDCRTGTFMNYKISGVEPFGIVIDGCPQFIKYLQTFNGEKVTQICSLSTIYKDKCSYGRANSDETNTTVNCSK